jgi:hypothetical protein
LKFKYSYILLLVFLSVAAHAEISSLSEEDVLFEKVYENPENIELNLKLVELQIKTGNIKGASITLERILQTYPNDVSTQLLYAQTEFKLGNSGNAKEIYTNIATSKFSNEEQRKLASENLKYIDDLNKHWEFFATSIFDYGQSKNPTNSPQYVTVLGNNYQNTGFSNKTDRFEELNLTVGLKYNLEGQTPSNIFSTFNYYDRHYNQFSSVDLRNYAWNIGYEKKAFGGTNVILNTINKTELSNQPYVNSDVLQLSHEHLINSHIKSQTGLAVAFNKHQECSNCASSDSRTNWMYGISESFTLALTDKLIVEANGNYSNYDAKANFESYELTSGILSTSYSSPFGILGLSKNYSYSHYGDIDPIAYIKREITLNTQGFSFITAPFHLKSGWDSWQDWFEPRSPKKDDWIIKFSSQWGKSTSEITTYRRDIEELNLSLIKNF